MATQNINGQIQFRRDTAHNWAVANPVLLAGELGFETDTRKGKVGDGTTTWNNLPYAFKSTFATGSANGTIAVDGTDVAVKGLGSAAYTASTDYAAASHNQASNTINAMTGYSKPSTTSAITASDSLNTAIGKLEKALEPDVSLSINDPGGSSVWIEVPVEHLIVGSTTPTDHNAIWIEIIS